MNLQQKLAHINELNQINNVKSESTITLLQSTRIGLFLIFSFIILIINTEEFISTQSSIFIMRDMKYNYIHFKHFTFIVLIGKITGAVLAFLFFNWTHRKNILLINLYCFSFALLVYFTTNDWWIILASRFIQGVSYIYPIIYTQVWIDQFGVFKWKGIMIAITQVALFLPDMFGGFVIKTMGIENWKYCFGLLGVVLLGLVLIISYTSNNYFNDQYYSISIKQDHNITSQPDSSLFKVLSQRTDILNNSINNTSLIFNLAYCLITLSRIDLVFATVLIQSSLNSYMTDVLVINNTQFIEVFNRFCLFWSPIAGVLFGGVVFQIFGGYNNNSTVRIALVFSLMCGILSHIIPGITSFSNFFAASTGFIFFSNGMIPLLIVLSFSCVPHEIKGSAYAVNCSFTWFFGSVVPDYLITYYISKGYSINTALKYLGYLILVNFGCVILIPIIKYKNIIKEPDSLIEEPYGTQLEDMSDDEN